MAQTIKLKRSSTSGRIPTTSDLELGEVAINTYDGKMYIKKSVSGTESIVEIGSGSSAEGIFEEYIYTATNAQTAFSGSDDNSLTLSYVSGAIQVFLNGILLDPDTDYTATNGTTVTLTSAASTSDLLQIFAFKKKISDGSVTVDTFSGNNSTTAFTLSLDPGDENNTRVFIDGVYQSKSNYSVSGTTLTFSSAPPTGTAIEVEIGNRNVTLDTTANLDLPDNVKLRLGTSQDLEIYHNGSHSFISDTGTGSLYIKGGAAVALRSDSDEDMLVANSNGAVTLYYDNSPKLTTTSYGADITGRLVTTSHIDAPDSARIRLGEGDDLMFYHDGTHSYVDNNTGSLYISSTASVQIEDNAGNDMITAGVAGAVSLFYNGSNKLSTTSTGVSVTGNIVTDGEIRGPATFVIDPAAVGDNTGTVQIKGNLQVDGATTTINSTTLTVDDLNITLASGATNAASANGAGITIDGASATLTYSSSDDTWVSNKTFVSDSGGADVAQIRAKYGSGNYLDIKHNLLNAVTSGGQDFAIQYGGTRALTVDSSRNIGIGIDDPEAKLHIVGHSRLDGAMLQKSNLSIASANISTDNEYISHNGPVLTNGSTGNINQYGYFRGYQAVYGDDGTNGFNPYAQGAYSKPIFEFISNNRGSISLPGDAAIRTGYLYQFVLGNNGSGSNSGVELTSSNTTLLWGITSSNNAYFANSVGIGTNSPTHQLHIHDSTTGTGSNYLRISHGHDSTAVRRQVGIIFGTSASNLGSTWTLESDSSTGYQDNAAFRFIHNAGGTPSERMRLTSAGNVGIGTESPSGISGAKILEVKNSSTGTGTHAQITLTGSNGHTNLLLASGDDTTGGDPVISSTTNHAIRFGHATNSTFSGFDEHMRIADDGRVGINRTPSITNSKLEVGGADNVSLINVEASGNTGGLGIGSSGLQLFHGSSAKMYLKSDGKVGIGGTNMDGQRLSIEGWSQSDTRTPANAWFVGRGTGGDGLAIGTSNSSPYATWIQSGYIPTMGTSNHYAIALNPHGGTVSIGDPSPPTGVRFAVQHDGLAMRIDGTANTERGIMLRNTGTANGYFKTDGNMRLIVEDANRHMSFYTTNTERMVLRSDGELRLGTGATQRPFAKETRWGYSTAYRVLMLGSSSTTYGDSGDGSTTISMGYDPSGNADGSFTGDGREILFRRGARFVTPNAADNDFYITNLKLLDGKVGIGTDSPSETLELTRLGKVGFGMNGNYGARIGYFDDTGGVHGFHVDTKHAGTVTSETRFVVRADSGRVGVGTKNPNANLHISSGTDTAVTVGSQSTPALQIGGTTNYRLGLYTDSEAGYIENKNGDNGIVLKVKTAGIVATVKSSGVELPEGEQQFMKKAHVFNQSGVSSYSTSTNVTYSETAATFVDKGEVLIGRVNARAYTDHINIRTNLSANNIMFYIRTIGYFYSYGMEECYAGGYTYYSGGNTVLSKDFQRPMGNTHDIRDLYRDSNGFLCMRIEVNHTGYTEGQMLIYMGGHDMSGSTIRNVQITDVIQRDDGTNAF